MEEMNWLGFVGSGIKLQRPRGGPLELRKHKGREKVPVGRKRGEGKGTVCSRDRAGPGESREWGKMWACSRERKSIQTNL